MNPLPVETRRETADRIMAIGEQHGRTIITELPVKDQIEVCERIVLTHPNRMTVLWARSLYLELTKKDLPA